MSDQAYRLRKLAELASKTSPNNPNRSQSDLFYTVADGGAETSDHTDQDVVMTNINEESVSESGGFDAAGVSPKMKKTRVVAVTSGKGGVGKTNLLTNMAIALSDLGQKVIVIDADLGLANIDVLLGIYPKYNLGHVVTGTKKLNEIITEGPRGIKIIPGASGLKDIAQLNEERRHNLMTDLVSFDGQADIFLIDTGAGLSSNVLDFVTAADEAIIVTTPEPTAIADAYAMIKVLYQTNPDSYIRLIINQVRNEAEAKQVIEQISSVARRFLNVYVEGLGFVVADSVVQRSVRAQKPFVMFYPYSAAASCIKSIAERLATGKTQSTNTGGIIGFMKRVLSPLGRRFDVV